jgi:hypothetical protein
LHPSDNVLERINGEDTDAGGAGCDEGAGGAGARGHDRNFGVWWTQFCSPRSTYPDSGSSQDDSESDMYFRSCSVEYP